MYVKTTYAGAFMAVSIMLDAGHGSGNLRKVTKASKYKKKGNRYPLLHQLLNRA